MSALVYRIKLNILASSLPKDDDLVRKRVVDGPFDSTDYGLAVAMLEGGSTVFGTTKGAFIYTMLDAAEDRLRDAHLEEKVQCDSEKDIRGAIQNLEVMLDRMNQRLAESNALKRPKI